MHTNVHEFALKPNVNPIHVLHRETTLTIAPGSLYLRGHRKSCRRFPSFI